MTRQAAQAVRYAETRLGVQTTYEEALKGVTDLEESNAAVRSLHQTQRSLEQTLADREWEVTSNERAANADMSATAFEKYIKGVLQMDEQCRALRGQIGNVVGKKELQEDVSRQLEFLTKIRVARMNQIGGYLMYLAAERMAGQGSLLGQPSQEAKE